MYFQGDPLTHPCIWSPPSPQENPISSPRFSIEMENSSMRKNSSVRIQREWRPHTNLATRPQVPRGFSGQEACTSILPFSLRVCRGLGVGGANAPSWGHPASHRHRLQKGRLACHQPYENCGFFLPLFQNAGLCTWIHIHWVWMWSSPEALECCQGSLFCNLQNCVANLGLC